MEWCADCWETVVNPAKHQGHAVRTTAPTVKTISGWVDAARPHIKDTVVFLKKDAAACRGLVSKTLAAVEAVALCTTIEGLMPETMTLSGLEKKAPAIRRVYEARRAVEKLRRAMEEVAALTGPGAWTPRRPKATAADDEVPGVVVGIRKDKTMLLLQDPESKEASRVTLPRRVPDAVLGSHVRVRRAPSPSSHEVRVTNANPPFLTLPGRVWLSDKNPGEGAVVCEGMCVDFDLDNKDSFFQTQCCLDLSAGQDVYVEVFDGTQIARRIY